MKKKAKLSFRAKTRPRESLQKPRLLLITEGEMEDKGLPELVKKMVKQLDLKFQVLTSPKRIRNGDTVPATKIAKDVNKICDMVVGNDAEFVACILDLEGRNITATQFTSDITPNIKSNNTIVGVAERSMENWLLGDINGMIRAVKPCNKPNTQKYKNADIVSHPAEREIKKHWTRYKKTTEGVKFLKSVCPSIIKTSSGSFATFSNSLIKLNSKI